MGARARWAGRRVTQYRVLGSKMGEERAGDSSVYLKVILESMFGEENSGLVPQGGTDQIIDK